MSETVLKIKPYPIEENNIPSLKNEPRINIDSGGRGLKRHDTAELLEPVGPPGLLSIWAVRFRCTRVQDEYGDSSIKALGRKGATPLLFLVSSAYNLDGYVEIS